MIEKTLALLGRRARDKITGFEGVAVSAAFDVCGVVQLTLDPGLGSDGKLVNAEAFDTNRLEILDGEPVMRQPEYPRGRLEEVFCSILGYPAADLATGFKGIAVMAAFDLFGCDQIAILPKAKKGKSGEGKWFNVNRVWADTSHAVIATGAIPTLEDKTEPSEHRTGGIAHPPVG